MRLPAAFRRPAIALLTASAVATAVPVSAQDQSQPRQNTGPSAADAASGPGGSRLATDNPLHGKRFKDWTLRCEVVPVDDAGQTAQQCHMFQDWQHEERQLRILHIAIAYPRQQPDQAVAVLTTPLGVYLPAGIQMQIDDGKPQKFVIERCEPVGCKTGFPLDETLLNALRRGAKANVSFADMRRQPLTVPVSLNGFTAALRALQQ